MKLLRSHRHRATDGAASPPGASCKLVILVNVSKEPDPNSPPGLADGGSRIARAADYRGDAAKLGALTESKDAGCYVIGGELVVLKQHGEMLIDVSSPRPCSATLCANCVPRPA